jgi:hypothetical protein
MRLAKTLSQSVENCIELVNNELRDTLHAYEPLELDDYCSDDLENAEAQAIKLRLAAEILLDRASQLETAIVAATSERWAAGPRD